MNELILSDATEMWGSSLVAAHGELYDLKDYPYIYEADGTRLLGYCFYRFDGNGGCEIMAIHSLLENQGVGGRLMQRVSDIAQENGAKRVYLTTTNDNTHAMRFYQRNGFSFSALRIGAVNEARKTLKPSIPIYGDDNIKLEHEIEFTNVLKYG